jgi:hypothetical protein
MLKKFCPKWIQIRNDKERGKLWTFKLLYDHFESIYTNSGKTLVVGYYHATCGHVITIDLKQRLILDSDSKNPQPFHFNTVEEYRLILMTCFNVIDIYDKVISNVFVLKFR